MSGEADRVVVLGAGIAGLLAARVLSDHVDQVSIVDRDTLPAAVESRRGVPQDRHIHALLPRGREVLDELFPGLTDQLRSAGAPMIDILGQARFAPTGRPLARVSTGLEALQASRPLIEGCVRERVRQLPNVELLDGCDVAGLAATGDHPGVRVTGARVVRRADRSAEEEMPATLTVDATGSTSRTPVWLEGLGCPRPREEVVRIGVGYASCRLRIDSAALDGDKFVGIGPAPGRPWGMALAAVEADQHLLTVYGYGGDHPPRERDGFVSFAARVAPPDVLAAIREAEVLDDRIASHGFVANLRRHYERLRPFPDGLVVTGDAICRFNPVYGQGMSVAALEAVALGRAIAGGRDRLGERFFRSVSKIVDDAWRMTTGADLGLPEVDGHRSTDVRLVNAYMRRLIVAAGADEAVTTAFLRAAGMVDRPTRLFNPMIATRVLRPRLRRGSNGAPSDGARGL
jgi:2-polyprenyl-6-methoxyphenol hydroxylase-like FAD-dependent oxidoreductase